MEGAAAAALCRMADPLEGVGRRGGGGVPDARLSARRPPLKGIN